MSEWILRTGLNNMIFGTLMKITLRFILLSIFCSNFQLYSLGPLRDLFSGLAAQVHTPKGPAIPAPLVAVNPQPAVLKRGLHDNPAPQERQKVRAAEAEIVDLSIVDDKADIMINQPQLLLQKNAWECGYFAMFHYFAKKHNYPKKSLQNRYKNFLRDLAKHNPEVTTLRKNKALLSTSQVEKFINSMKKKATDVIVIEEQCIGHTLPLEALYIDQINVARASGQPFWILLCTLIPQHWVCLQFTPDDCIGIDSYQGPEPLANQIIVQKVAALCLGEIPLPTRANYTHIRRAIQRKINKNEDPSTILPQALERGFTQETFESLCIDRGFIA